MKEVVNADLFLDPYAVQEQLAADTLMLQMANREIKVHLATHRKPIITMSYDQMAAAGIKIRNKEDTVPEAEIVHIGRAAILEEIAA